VPPALPLRDTPAPAAGAGGGDVTHSDLMRLLRASQR
jgi:hypothetical protein